jgi:hypothetical protein
MAEKHARREALYHPAGRVLPRQPLMREVTPAEFDRAALI